MLFLLVLAKKAFDLFFLTVKTENAELISFDDLIEADAFAVRDEKILTYDSKFVHVNLHDGSKVARNETIAVISDKIPELKENSFIFEDIDDAYSFKKNITKKIRSLKSNENLFEFFNKNSKNFYNLSEKISADDPGYFTTFTDGFENFGYNTKEFNFDLIHNTEEHERLKNSLGKIVTSQKCKLACKIKKEDAQKLYGHNSFACKFELNNNFVNFDVCHFVPINEEYILIILNAPMTEYLINFRHEKIKIRSRRIEGIKVNKLAIKQNKNGCTGVFIKYHKKLHFKKINILFENSDFIICEKYDNPDAMNFGDQIVIHGNDIFDGKYVL
jgi:hypothetical protein